MVNYVASVNKYRVAFSRERARLEAPAVAATGVRETGRGDG